jgi:hypothetical protein
MKSYNKKIYSSFILSFFFIVACANFVSGANKAKQKKTLGEIYRSGVITFEPVLKISLDSIPNRVQAKKLSKLVQGTDKLYVSDLILSDVKIFNLDGTFRKKIGIKGRGPGDLLVPIFMCFARGRLVVWESGNRRFSYFSEDGKFIKIAKPKLKGRLEDMKVLEDGRIVLEITRVEANKEKKEIFEWRVLELYSSEMKFIKEVYRQKEHLYKYFKNPRPHFRIPLPFQPRLSWGVLPGKKIAVGFPRQYKIKILYVDTGKVKIISRDYSPQKVTGMDKKEYLGSQLVRVGGILKKGVNKFVSDNAEFPDFKPAFKKIITDRESHILVFTYTESDQGKSNNKATHFDVFDSDGTFVNYVKILDNKDLFIPRVISVENNEFWFHEEGSLDTVFVKYKVR